MLEAEQVKPDPVAPEVDKAKVIYLPRPTPKSAVRAPLPVIWREFRIGTASCRIPAGCFSCRHDVEAVDRASNATSPCSPNVRWKTGSPSCRVFRHRGRKIGLHPTWKRLLTSLHAFELQNRDLVVTSQ